MRKIKPNIFPKIKSQVKALKTTRTAKITFGLNAALCQQAENWLNSQWVQHDYTHNSLSELIRRSLQTYQEGEIEINLTERDKYAPKREITIRFGSVPDLLNFYYSLPYSQRTAIIEGSLAGYLEKLNAKELEKYVKVIERKPKIESKPKLIPYYPLNFICDNCGDEYRQDTAYSYARSLDEINDYRTYCRGCVR